MELEALLAPIAGASPCGEDMSFSTEFDQIADMRRQDDPTLDQGEWVTSLKVADWPGVSQACTTLLSTRTKDLRLAMWLTEAQAITHGYEGLDQGLQLCAQLCERYWSDLHPQADAGDFEERIGNIGWLLHRVVALSDALPFTKGRQGAAYSLRDLATARQNAAQSDRDEADAARQGADALTVEKFNRALKETPSAHLLARLQSARHCEAHLLAWQQIVDGHLGADGPGFVQAKEALASVIHQLERLARDAGALHDGGSAANGLSDDLSGNLPDQSDDIGTDGPAANRGTYGQGGPLRTRAQAIQQLREVASFFRRTEPHSPVAYLAEKAVKWGEMPLHEWLRKVIKDQGAMSHLEELLGLDDNEGQDA
ncbi:MAG: type VI secretion system protein TssA [Aquabacterium sp.]|uniref:type VI secretion system protein TssA n=1 Tax=Aquabacterium sp. TaxID=1872578 RepID=UPI0025C2B1E3|nr:type VI secretion system protein TssA [Aquabacterium sp.]MBI5925222.1 type VI secretion system protein TssA [Aquabacterium sp.]